MGKQLIAVVVASVLVATGLQFVQGAGRAGAEDPPKYSTGYHCDKDVLFVGLRGSGEKVDEYDGMGRFVAKQREIMADQLYAKGRSLTSVAIIDPDYPARPTSDLGDVSNGILTNTNRFFEGVSAGKAALRKLINGWAADSACSKQRLVLAGYSQGAMVIHQVINDLDFFPGDPVRNRIDRAILIADPDNSTSDPNVKQAMKDLNGIGIDRAVAPPGSVRNLDGSWNGKAFSICRTGDGVCAFDGNLPKFIEFVSKGARRHETYLEVTPFMSQAARETKFQFPDYKPQIDNGSLNISLTAGAPANAQLKATTDAVCKVAWELRGLPPLPAGLSLSSDGLLTGTPTANGTFRVPVRAAAKCERREDKLSATVRMTIIVFAPCDTTSSTPLVSVPYAHEGQLYDQVWTFPQLSGCKSFTVIATPVSPNLVLALYKPRFSPVFNSAGRQTGLRAIIEPLGEGSYFGSGEVTATVVRPDGSEAPYRFCFGTFPKDKPVFVAPTCSPPPNN